MNRPQLDKNMGEDIFCDFYYLKEELVAFCKHEDIQATGSKDELTNRIAHFLKTGKRLKADKKRKIKNEISSLLLEDKIEENFVCSEVHRAFFKENIGNTFSFNVKFQQWLKQNSGKTYKDAIDAYYKIIEDKKQNKTTIDKQFEYNTYIRDFFDDNKGASLKDAIKCWKYKKSLAGHNRYEKEDLRTL